MLIYEVNGGSSRHTEGGDRNRTLISNLGIGNESAHCNIHHHKRGRKFNRSVDQASPLTSKEAGLVPQACFFFTEMSLFSAVHRTGLSPWG